MSNQKDIRIFEALWFGCTIIPSLKCHDLKVSHRVKIVGMKVVLAAQGRKRLHAMRWFFPFPNALSSEALESRPGQAHNNLVLLLFDAFVTSLCFQVERFDFERGQWMAVGKSSASDNSFKSRGMLPGREYKFRLAQLLTLLSYFFI